MISLYTVVSAAKARSHSSFINNCRFVAIAVLSTGSGQMIRSLRVQLQLADFILPCVSLSTARPSYFTMLAKPVAVLSRPADFNDRFIAANDFNGRFIAAKSGKPRWPFYQQSPRQLASPNGRFINDVRFIKAQANEGLIDPGPLFGGRFRVILFGASLTLARHVQWLHARARLTGGGQARRLVPLTAGLLGSRRQRSCAS